MLVDFSWLRQIDPQRWAYDITFAELCKPKLSESLILSKKMTVAHFMFDQAGAEVVVCTQKLLCDMETLVKAFEWLTRILDAASLLPDFSTATGIFCAIAWIATLISAITFVVAFVADIGDSDFDAGSVDGGSGSFSVQAVMGFVLGFGWGGYLAVVNGSGVGLGITVGVLVGVVMFFLIAGIIKAIYSLKSDGSLKYESLVGMTGTVYVTIPPHGEPGGQVQVSHPSQLITMAAVQEGSDPLPAQTRIEVVAATTYQLTVRPLSPQTSSTK